VKRFGPAWYEAQFGLGVPPEKETRTAHAATSAWASAPGIGTLFASPSLNFIGITEPALRCSAGSGSKEAEELVGDVYDTLQATTREV
jgi:hypothetical protein